MIADPLTKPLGNVEFKRKSAMLLNEHPLLDKGEVLGFALNATASGISRCSTCALVRVA